MQFEEFNKQTALHAAAIGGYLSVVHLLIQVTMATSQCFLYNGAVWSCGLLNVTVALDCHVHLQEWRGMSDNFFFFQIQV